MLIVKSSLKPFTTELPASCADIIREMISEGYDPDVFIKRLEKLSELCGQTGKVELAQYFEVLNLCDAILQFATQTPNDKNRMTIDETDNFDGVVIAILKFTSVLFENTFFRSTYASFSEIVKLLGTSKPRILVATLRLMVSISKTSRFISQHVDPVTQKLLSSELMAIHEAWNQAHFTSSVKLVDPEYEYDNTNLCIKIGGKTRTLVVDPNIPFWDGKKNLEECFPEEKDTDSNVSHLAFAQYRFIYHAKVFEDRIDCIIARLMALSAMFYSRCLLDEWRTECIINDAIIEEICELVQINSAAFSPEHAAVVDNLRTESLKTLASIVFLEKPKKIQQVVDTLGLNTYIGFGANLVRKAVDSLKKFSDKESPGFITALFSLIYHIAGFEYGGHALVGISAIATLLEVVSLTDLPDNLISFATRAVRIIDILTSYDLVEFNNLDGIQIVIKRLVYEIEKCQSYLRGNHSQEGRRFVCHHHRSALIKSLLNFLKRAVVDSVYAAHSRRIMDGDLPKALINIVENPQYYGSALVYCALDLTTVFIYQEPAQLNMLQDCKLPHAIIDLFFSDQFPISREIVTSLPNICSALCLNERGLKIFNGRKPLERIFRIIFSSSFIQLLKKRKNELNDSASQLGTTFDELMRHQPTIRTDLISALVKVIGEIIKLTEDESVLLTKPTATATTEDKDKPGPSRRSSVAHPQVEEDAAKSIEKFTELIKAWVPAGAPTGAEPQQSKFVETDGIYIFREIIHLVGEAPPEKAFSFDFKQDNYLALNDYMVLLVRMIDGILSNSSMTENSNAMLECGLHDQLISFFTAKRFVPLVSNPSYLHSLPNVFRLLLQQSRSIKPFEVMLKTLQAQLAAYKQQENITDFISAEHQQVVSRLSLFLAVFVTFLRSSLTTAPYEIRSMIFYYLATEVNGTQFIKDVFASMRIFGISLAQFKKDFVSSGAPMPPKRSMAADNAADVITEITEAHAIAERQKSESTAPVLDASAYHSSASIYKQMQDTIVQFGRFACNGTRNRRPDPVFMANTAKVAEKLFVELRTQLVVTEGLEFYEQYAFYVIPLVRRLIFDEFSYPYPMMLPYFFETGCHEAFFALGEKIVQYRDFKGTTLINWMLTAQRFVSIEAILGRARSDKAPAKNSFSLRKYLKVCQLDTLNSVMQVFNILNKYYKLDESSETEMDTADEPPLNYKEPNRFVEIILAVFKDLISGICQLHAEELPPAQRMDKLYSELDNGKIQILMDMGFTRENAMSALAVNSNVADAAEYLLLRGGGEGTSRRDDGASSSRPQQSLETIDEQMPSASAEGGESSTAAVETPAAEVAEAAPVEETPEQPTRKEYKLEEATFIDYDKHLPFICDEVLPLFFKILESQPSAVYSLADVVKALVTEGNAKKWISDVLVQRSFLDRIMELLNQVLDNPTDAALESRFAWNLHLVCLLWSDLADLYTEKVIASNFHQRLVDLLKILVEKENPDFKLLASVLLWIDLYGKEWRTYNRRQLFRKAVDGPMQWFYWPEEDRYSTSQQSWREFAPNHASQLTEAFREGRNECRVDINERTYYADFLTMTQRHSDRSFQTEPICVSIKLNPEFSVREYIREESKQTEPDEVSMAVVKTCMDLLKRLNGKDDVDSVIFSTVSLIHRLTCVPNVAKQFMADGGVTALLQMSCPKQNVLMSSVICLILRNCIDNPHLTSATLERVVRALHNGAPVTLSEQSSTKPMSSRQRRYQKDWRRVLRLLTPFIDHNLESFVNTAEKMLAHREMGELQAAPNAPSVKDSTRVELNDLIHLKAVVNAVIAELVDCVKDPEAHKQRVLQPTALLLFIAELVRSYPQASAILLARLHDERHFLQYIIEDFLLPHSSDSEALVAANAVFLSLMNANSTVTSNTIIVDVIQKSLLNIVESVRYSDYQEKDGREFTDKVTLLTKFMGLLRDCCVSNGLSPRSKDTFVHLAHEKNLLVDFTAAIRYLPLNQNYVVTATDAVLKLFEEFCRSIGLTKSEPVKVARPAASVTASNVATAATTQPVVASATVAANVEQPANADGPSHSQADAAAVDAPAHANPVNDIIAGEQAHEIMFEPIMDLENGGIHNDAIEDDYEDEHDGFIVNRSRSPTPSSVSVSSDDGNDDGHDDHVEHPDDSHYDNVMDESHDQPSEASDEEDEDVLNMNRDDVDVVGGADGGHVGIADRQFDDVVIGDEDFENELIERRHPVNNDPGRESAEEHEDEDNDTEMDEDEDVEDDEELDTEFETAEEEESMPNADNGGNNAVFDLDLQLDVLGNAHDGRGPNGGLLRIRNSGALPDGIRENDIVNASMSILADYMNGLYGGGANRTRPQNVVYGVNGDADGGIRGLFSQLTGSHGSSLNQSAGTLGTLSAARADSFHPLLRRPSTAAAAPRTSTPVNTQRPPVNIQLGIPSQLMAPGEGHRDVFGGLNAAFSSFESAFDALHMGRRHRSTRHTHRHTSNHHTLRRQNALRSRPMAFRTNGGTARFVTVGTGRAQIETQLQNLLTFGEQQGMMRVLDNTRGNSTTRGIVESFIPFVLDRLADSTRLLNAYSINYAAMVINAYLTEACRLPEPPPPLPSATAEADANSMEAPASNETAGTTGGESSADTDASASSRAAAENDDEQRSTDGASIDSSELTNRFANMENTDTLETGVEIPADGERTPTAELNDTLEAQPVDTMEVEPTVSAEPAAAEAPPSAEPMDAVENPPPASSEPAAPAAEQAENVDAEPQPGPSGLQQPNDEEIDPDFLAALPEDIRQEVLRDFERQRRIQQSEQQQRQAQEERQRQQSQSAAADGSAPAQPPPAAPEGDDALDPEFLAALPPELRDEILAQHEQLMAQRAAPAAPPANANAAPADDAVALFESLAPSLRAQVLAEADDSVLQILPENLVAEANRLRRNLEEQQIRMAQFSNPISDRRVSYRIDSMAPAGTAQAPATRIVQIFDRDSIATIALLYFLDQEKFCLTRFQRVFKVVALHPGSCDYVLRALLSLLHAASTDAALTEEDVVSLSGQSRSWIDGFRVQSTLNSPERALSIIGKKVVVHELYRAQLCTRILDTFLALSRQFSRHFLTAPLRFTEDNPKPDKLGIPEPIDAFWDVVRSISEKMSAPKVEPNKELAKLEEVSDDNVKNSPFGLLLEFATKEPMISSPSLLDKVMRILYQVLTTPMNNQQPRKDLSLASSDEEFNDMLEKFRILISAVMENPSSDDSLRDCRNFLIQLMYAFPQLRHPVFKILYNTVLQQGLKLSTVLASLREAFALQSAENKEKADPNSQASTSSASRDKLGNSIRALSPKQNSPKNVLRSLNLVSQVRNQLDEMYKRKKPHDADRDAFLSDEARQSEDDLLYVVLDNLNELWNTLSDCLDEIHQQGDTRAVMSLQYVAEAFFLSHALTIRHSPHEEAERYQSRRASTVIPPPAIADPDASTSEPTTATTPSEEPKEPVKYARFMDRMLAFAERHRTVLNQILRSNKTNAMENSAFGVLTYFPKLLDFDVKRKYFYKEIQKLDDRSRYRQEDVAVRVRRSHLFSDSYRELFRLRSTDWKCRFYIIFEGEEGQDAGGLLREWYSIITREVFNPNYALFITAPGDGVTYMINKLSHVNPEHLAYFKFVGRIIAKAISDNKQLDCYFTRAFYKQILNLPVRYQDIESEDPDYFKNLKFLLENPLETAGVDLNFSLEVEEFGVRSWRELKEGGAKIAVTDENKEEYVKLVCQMKMTGAVRKQLDAFLEGFYEIIPKKLISIFNEQELELLISGLPDIDIDDLYNNTEYKQYTRSSPQIQWFWRALRSFVKEDLAKFLQFVTGTSKVPLQGFAHLEGMNGAQKFTIHLDSRSNDRLPCAHTCFNQLDLPQYDNYEQLRERLLIAIRECTEGFAFA